MKKKRQQDRKRCKCIHPTLDLKEIIQGPHWCPQCQEYVQVNISEDRDNMYLNCSKCNTGLTVINFLSYFDKFGKRLEKLQVQNICSGMVDPTQLTKEEFEYLKKIFPWNKQLLVEITRTKQRPFSYFPDGFSKKCKICHAFRNYCCC